MSQYFQLHQKKALICGASQGIGEACAKLFAEAGAHVTLIARRQDDLDRVSRELSLVGGSPHRTIALDLSKTEEIEPKLGPERNFDIIVHNVAGPKAGALIQGTEDEFSEALRLHLFSAQKLAQLILPGMQNRRWGRWINIISTSVKAPIPNLGVSNTVRGAMASWSKTMAMEQGPFGITFNNILPGYTRTPRFEALKSQTAQLKGTDAQKVEQSWIDQVPARRIGEPREIAMAALFLASSEAAYVNGINLPVDGGRTPSL